MAKKITANDEIKKAVIARVNAERLENGKDVEFTEQAFYKALRYESNSDLACKVRKWAVEMGAKEWITKDEIESSANTK